MTPEIKIPEIGGNRAPTFGGMPQVDGDSRSGGW